MTFAPLGPQDPTASQGTHRSHPREDAETVLTEMMETVFTQNMTKHLQIHKSSARCWYIQDTRTGELVSPTFPSREQAQQSLNKRLGLS